MATPAASSGRKAGVAQLAKILSTIISTKFPAKELEYGAVTLNNAFVCIDEIKKLDKRDRRSLRIAILDFLPLVKVMGRAQDQLAKCGDSILKAPNQVPPSLAGLFCLAQMISTIIVEEVKKAVVLHDKTYRSIPKGTLHQLASTAGLAAECFKLFQRAVNAPGFQPDADLDSHVSAIESTLSFVQIQMAFYSGYDSTHVPLAALAALEPLESKGIIGSDSALDNLEFCIGAIHDLPGGFENPALPKEPFLAFLHAWNAVCFPFLTWTPCLGDFARPLARVGTPGISLFVEAFCRTADALLQEGRGLTNSSPLARTSSGTAGDPSMSPSQCLIATTRFWNYIARLGDMMKRISPPLYAAEDYLVSPRVQAKVQAATGKVQTHLLEGRAAAPRAAKKKSLQKALQLQMAALAAQSACYELFITDLKKGPWRRRVPLEGIEVLKRVAPGVQSMIEVVKGIRESLKRDDYTQFNSAWELLEISSNAFLGKTCEILAGDKFKFEPIIDMHINTASDGYTARYTPTQIGTEILGCVTSLLELDVAFSELLAAHPSVWYKRRDDSLTAELEGATVGMSLVLANALLGLSGMATYDLPSDLDLRNAALNAMDAAIKCQIVFGRLPETAQNRIFDLWASQGPNIETSTWLECILENINVLYTVLTRTQLGASSDSPLKSIEDADGNSTVNAAALAMLHASGHFQRSLGCIVDWNVYSLCVLVEELAEVSEHEPVLLSSDVSALGALSRHIALSAQNMPEDTLKNAFEGYCIQEKEREGSESGSPTGHLFYLYEEALQQLENLIKAAQEEEGLSQRRIRRCKALSTRTCCNLECTTMPRDEKIAPRAHCEECRAVHYCSSECERGCWNEHQMVCKEMIQEAK